MVLHIKVSIDTKNIKIKYLGFYKRNARIMVNSSKNNNQISLILEKV